MPSRPTGAADEAALLASERRRRASRTAIRTRWGPQRVIRLDGIPPAEREAIIALIEAVRAGREAAAAGRLEKPGDGPSGGRDAVTSAAD